MKVYTGYYAKLKKYKENNLEQWEMLSCDAIFAEAADDVWEL